MQNNSTNGDDFQTWLEKKQAKDPTYNVVRREDLTQLNDTSCKHEHLEIDETETDFDCVRCKNTKCGKMWLFPLGSVRNKLKKEE